MPPTHLSIDPLYEGAGDGLRKAVHVVLELATDLEVVHGGVAQDDGGGMTDPRGQATANVGTAFT